jgi:divalent metal cation (Fe/Co/Zn/Cd) transporter
VSASSGVTAAEVQLNRRGLGLAWFTIGYNVAEGAVAVTAGALAGLVSLVGFGIDSGIESISAVLVAMRLLARLRHGTVDEAREHRALRLVAVTFFLLAGYVLVEGIRSLLVHEVPDTSVVGIVVLVASLVVMPLLAAAKRRVGVALGGDPLILADAAETRLCVLLSASTLAGLVLFQLTGAAWLDPIAGFVIAGFAVHEGLEAWRGELVEIDDH